MNIKLSGQPQPFLLVYQLINDVTTDKILKFKSDKCKLIIHYLILSVNKTVNKNGDSSIIEVIIV